MCPVFCEYQETGKLFSLFRDQRTRRGTESGETGKMFFAIFLFFNVYLFFKAMFSIYLFGFVPSGFFFFFCNGQVHCVHSDRHL